MAVATLAEAFPLVGLRGHLMRTGMGFRKYRFQGATALLSAGFAGSCQAWLKPGAVVLQGHDDWRLAEGLGAAAGPISTSGQIADPSRKRQLGAAGAFAVDMETAHLAEAARSLGIPFLSVRVIIDGLMDRAVSPVVALRYPVAAAKLSIAVRRALALWP